MTLLRRRSAHAGALVGALFMLGAFACGGGDAPVLCGQIPAGGCPVGRGGTCADPTCGGLYDCVDGRWRETTACLQNAGGRGGAGSSSVSASSSSGACNGGMLNHMNEVKGGGCTPDLESPDCVSDVVETCHPCVTGCIDFFMCEAHGWTEVAHCDSTGKLIVTQ